MLTITISARTLLLAAALIAVGALTALYATSARGSGPYPDSILQGDTDCDGDVDTQDALNDLRYVGGLTVGPFGSCPQIGTEAAIPGPQGPKGDKGDPGVNLFANIDTDGNIISGNATGVQKPFDHIFRVTFAEDVSQCAAVVTPGTNPGGSGGYYTRAIPSTVIGNENEHTVRVGFLTYDNNGVSTDFHLLVVC